MSITYAPESAELAPDFTAFYTEWFPRNVAHVRLKYRLEREDAEDIVQNAFLDFLRQYPAFRDRADPAVCLRVCVTSRAVRFLQRHHFMDSLDTPLFEEGGTTLADTLTLSATGLSTEDQAILNVELAELSALVAEFNPVWRFVMLRTAAGYSLAEIHQELVSRHGYGSTLKAIQHVLTFAHRALRQQHQVRKLAPRPTAPREGPWSAHFAACVRCGGTQFRFAAHGMCQRCYKHERWQAHHGKATGRVHKTQWAEAYQACQGCGTTERPHLAKGYCRPCYRARFEKPWKRHYPQANEQMW